MLTWKMLYNKRIILIIAPTKMGRYKGVFIPNKNKIDHHM